MTGRTYPISLADGTYSLKFDNHALYRFEELQGEGAVMVIMRGLTGVRTINHFIWAGLLHEHPHMTITEVIAKVDTHQMQEYAKTISEAIDHALDSGNREDSAKKKAVLQK